MGRESRPGDRRTRHRIPNPFQGLLRELRPPRHFQRTQHEQDLSGGLLVSRQSLWVVGTGRSLGYMPQMPDRLETAHLRGVERLSLGLCQCRRSGTRVEVRLLRRWLVLGLQDQVTLRENRRCLRRWTLERGLLCRPSAKGNLGTLSLGADATPAPGGLLRWHLWCSVEGYPSRFLATPGRLLPPRWVGALYAAFHRWTALAVLQALARDLAAPRP
ncbi:MAG TPA: hypothetical protein VGN26_00195 [Armatimonadota bacterium]|jgi:hypothetical protein